MALPDRKHDGKLQYGPLCAWHGSGRNPSHIRWVVIHSAEGTNAQNIASWGASQGAVGRASWHVVVDQKVAIRCLHDDVIGYHAYSPANDIGLGLEIGGHAKWSKYQWFVHQATLKRAAWVTARWCVKYNIPARWLTPAQIMAGEPGILTHHNVTKVLGKGSHWDPGPGFPKGYFLYLVKRRIGWLTENV